MILTALAVYLIFQIALPLRHHLFKGNVNWTEEGHRMSWRMMLRAKQGTVSFLIKDKNSGDTWSVSPRQFLSPNQSNSISKKPDMIWQFAQFLHEHYNSKGKEVEVYAKSKLSLNMRPHKPLINEKFDLATVEWQPFRHSEWVLTDYE